MSSPRIVIVGAGGVGAPFGSALARAGHDVTFIARGDHLRAIQAHGLRVEGTLGNFHLNPAKATDDPASLGPVDYVLFTPKLWDVEATGEFIKPLIGADTGVIPLQNGIDAAERLAPILGEGHVMGGVAAVSAAIAEPGLVRQMAEFQMFLFGELDGSRSPRALRLQAICDASDLDGRLSDDIRYDMWWKFCFLSSGAAITAVTRQRTKVALTDPDMRRVYRSLFEEVVAVGQACGVNLADGLVDELLAREDGFADGWISSMAMDLLRGKRLELPWLSGKVVELGREKGVPTPTTFTLYAMLKPYIDGRPEGSPTG